ncbi:Lecithin-cholesterol acyltransferase-like 4 [Rhynchospora pubera]|uniref:Lecithin-cholesterol acyltransferase-like 4 n=1 Tax=Rhynchospora pubera TaxID=906938 RepID=A0AAV8CG66_9POAL|nr:Lecithin-cholesterol acyltransferase-like 4 [Rhynchospora pubera]
MAVLDELIRSIELWMRASRKHDVTAPNPELDPVLLVPGIGGSMLNAIDENGKTERVWVRIFGADHEFRTKLWPRFDPSSGKTISVDEKIKIEVPEDRHGLYAIDVLDPDMIIESEGVCYYHDMIVEMIKWGYQEGKTLFGFGYDFRQSNRLQETLDRFASKLESAYASSGGKKINVVTHSMGGLLVKCFMALHTEPKYICVNGDGTVPVESAKADGLDAIARVGVPADHRGIICNRHVFRILKHWLKAGEPDPFYNPLNDFVILPTAFEVGNDNKDADIHVTSVKEDWQLLFQNNCQGNNNDDLLAMVGSLSVSSEGKDGLTDEAHATVVVQTDCGKHVEVSD